MDEPRQAGAEAEGELAGEAGAESPAESPAEGTKAPPEAPGGPELHPALAHQALPPFVVAKLEAADAGLAVEDLAWAGAGARLVTVDAGGTARVWDTGSWARLRELPAEGAAQQGGAWRVAISQDGGRVLITRGHAAQLHASDTGEQLLSLAHEGPTRAVALSADAELLASGGADGLRTWTAEGKARAHRAREGVGVVELRASADGRRLIAAWDDGLIEILEARKAKLAVAARVETQRADGARGRVVLAADGARFAAPIDERAVGVFELASGERVAELPYPQLLAIEAHANLLLASATLDSGEVAVQLIDVRAGEAVRDFLGHGGALRAASFSPDGSLFVSASADGSALVWAAP